MAISSNARPYGGGRYFIELDNQKAGWVKDVDGGHAEGEVITEKIGSDVLFKKAISNVKYNDVSFKCGAGMTKPLYQWIENSFTQQHNQKGKGRTQGAIVCGDYDYNEVSRIDFYESIISEFAMPALDASSKDAAAMTVKFTPEKTRYTTGGGKSFHGQMAISPKQKLWTCANFKLMIDGIPDDTVGKVTKVDALTIKQKIVQHYTGKARDYEIEATSVETPNLVITLAEAFAKPFFDWHEDFVIKGNCDDTKEKTGSLLYLAQNAKDSDPLFTLDFSQLGIFKVTPEKVEVGDKIRYVKVEMYCERIKFKYGGSAVYGSG